MRILFAGTPEFAVPALRLLLNSNHDIVAVYTQPDRPAGRGRKLQASPVKELAVSAGIPLKQPVNFKDPDEIDRLRNLTPDLMIVVAYGLILPQAVLDVPKLGCINIHASLLPRWRGAAPIQRALMAGDTTTGTTIMQISRKLDAGDMLHKEECSIEAHETAGELHDKLAELGAKGLAKVLADIESGHLNPEIQDESLVTYAEKLSKEEADLDWMQPARQLDRQVRGLNPWPVAQTRFQGQNLRIWRAEPVSAEKDCEPGTVICDHKNLNVATGEGWLRLLEVQLPSGKRMPSQAFLSAHQVNGVKLG